MQRNVFVVSAIGAEAPYLLEWIAHYLALGFDGALLFTDHSPDGTVDMAKRLEELGHVRHIPMKRKDNRHTLRQALRELPKHASAAGAEWVFPVDIDEFLCIHAGEGQLQDLFKAVGDSDAISICRRAFGSAGRRGLPCGDVRETYRMAARPDDHGRMVTRGFKTLVRTDRPTRYAPHRPYFEGLAEPVQWVDAGGKPMPESYLDGKWTIHETFHHDFARLHYHPVLSPEAMVIRRGVPTNEGEAKTLEQAWERVNVNTVEDDRIATAVQLSKELLEKLRADEVLGKLEEKGRLWHQTRAAALATDPLAGPLCERLAEKAEEQSTDAQSEEVAEEENEPQEPLSVRTSPRGGGGRYEPPPVRPIRFKVKPSPSGQTHAVLHGGFHKTATTYMQSLLEDNEAWLGTQSVLMLQHLKLRKHITFPSQLEAYRRLKIQRRTRFSEGELRGFTESFFAEPIALKPERIILSDENIPGLPSHCVTTGLLYRHRREFFKCFAERIPIPITDAFFAVRNYADFFASSYVEYLRAATTTTTEAIHPPEAMKRALLASLPNWSNVFEDFAQVFPDVRIHIWRFEDFRALKPSILSRICGDHVDISKLQEPAERNVRPSASARAVEELVLISELEGAGAMAENVSAVQGKFPPNQDYGRFDPWSVEERAHLTRLYDKDWDALRSDGRWLTLEP